MLPRPLQVVIGVSLFAAATSSVGPSVLVGPPLPALSPAPAPAHALHPSHAPAPSHAPVSAAKGSDPPNVVIVMTDDQRSPTMGRMPTVQRELVDKGTQFPNAIVPTALCCPSRVSTMTGLYAHSTGIYDNWAPHGGWVPFHERGHESRTVPAALDRRGYHSALVGKYLNGFGKYAPKGYTPPGWDSFVTFTGAEEPESYYDYTLNDGSRHGSAPQDYSTDVLADRAVDVIADAPPDRPLFLMFTPNGPHKPYTPAPRHDGRWADLPPFDAPSVTEDVADKPRWVRELRPIDQADVDHERTREQESLMSVDDAVGDLVAALRDSGRMRNTLFVFTSDNGVTWGDHHMRAKSVPYRSATEVPLVVRWDGRVPAGRGDQRLAVNVDIAETIADVTSTPMPTEGLSLVGERRRAGAPLEAIRAGGINRPAYCGWRSREWLYVRYATGEEELYSYRDDPFELRNLAGEPRHANRLADMRARARARCVPQPPGFRW